MKNKAIQVENFTKHYKGRKEPAVDSVSFVVEQGAFHGLIGSNGSGKTTTIKSVIRAYINYQGSIKINGIKNSKKEARKLIGYIPERASFPSGMTAKSYLYHMAKMSNIPHVEAKKETDLLLKRFDIEELANKKPATFSSGQKKKILLAQALIHKPKILIMDEPAANLDPIARADFFKTLKQLNAEGITIFITSHILAELDNFISSVTIINNGKLSYSGKLSEMKKTNILVVETNNNDDFKKISSISDFILEPSQDKNVARIKLVSNQQENIMGVVKKILKHISPKSYYVETISLQDIYNRFVEETPPVTETKKKFNIRKWLW